MSWYDWLMNDLKSPQDKEPTWCVPSAIFCAWVWSVKRQQKVRMAVTSISTGLDHVQAEALIDGKWTPLTEIWDGTSMAVIPYKRHYPEVEPYRFVSLKDWIDEQIQFTVPPLK